MLKKYFQRASTSTPLQKISTYWDTFLHFHSVLCETERSDRANSALSYPEIQGVLKMFELIIDEDKIVDSSRTLRPCMEYLITSKVFEILTAAAQIDVPNGLLLVVTKLFRKLLKHINNQDLIPQMSFHSSLSSLLHIINSLVSSSAEDMKASVLKLLSILLEKIHTHPGLMGLFIYNYEKKSEFLPLSILVLFFNDELFYKYNNEAFIYISKITDKSLLRVIVKDHELPLNLISKLAFYFQIRNVEAIKIFSGFLQRFLLSCASKEFQEEIVDVFYENFCVPILTPRLQSSEYSTRINASILLTIVVQEINNINILMSIVYFFQGKEKDGSKRLKPLVSTPTSSNKKTFDFEVDLNKGCKPISDISKMWETLIYNLNNKYEQLSIYTLKILYYLLSQGGKKIVKLLITDFFSGSPPTDHVSITAEIFLSLIPPSIVPKSLNKTFSEYFASGYLKCSYALSTSKLSLHEFSEHTGDSLFKEHAGETGGTEANFQQFYIETSQKFFEGDILHVILMKFKNFLQNSLEENLYVTGIISTLSAFPKELGSFSALHNFLLEPQTSSKDNFLTFFKHLALDIDMIFANDASIFEKIESAAHEMGISLKLNESFYENIVMGRIRTKKSKSLIVEDKRNIEAIVVFQEFIKEMASILLFKEVLDDMASRARADDDENT